MIPNELVYRAAQAMWETGTTSKWRDDVWAAPHLTRARAALEAVAADIWEQGYAACSHNRWLDESVYATEDDEEQNNPYIQETN